MSGMQSNWLGLYVAAGVETPSSVGSREIELGHGISHRGLKAMPEKFALAVKICRAPTGIAHNAKPAMSVEHLRP